ncbi:MAG: transporter substrate-binding domain-containing protein, partial [Rhodococcus sp.]|nr:transporter substrate-binding domain-containing protein [Rhodococcus sp. (in: high G+C Gram-positive bacteria)]
MRVTAAVLVCASGVTGCATAQTSVAAIDEGEVPYTAAPWPNGARFADPIVVDPAGGSSAADDCNDPTASLRPGASGPTPTIDAIRARGRLIVGLDTGSNLMSFRDPSTGQISGFDVDIAREVARDLFGDPDRLDFRILTSADRLRALQEGSVDIVAKTMSITCERRRSVEFSSQ